MAIRASWGIIGNQAFPAGLADYQYAFTSSTSSGQTNIPNPNLKWEKTNQINMGVDFSILKGRIYGSIDYYKKTTSDLLFGNIASPPAPSAIVYTNLPAKLKNSGIEIALGSQVIKMKDFSWDVDVNAAFNKNILRNYDGALIFTGAISGQGVSGSSAQATANNQPANVYYLKPFRGFNDKGQQIIGDVPEFSGDPNPSFLAGLSTTITYKKFSLSMNGSGSFGYLIYNNTYNTVTPITNLSKGLNAATNSLDLGESASSGISASARYLESGNFFKLRNATLQYNFGDVAKIFKNLRVYVGAVNLFVLTKYKGFDPEVNVDKNLNGFPSRNIEFAPYPTPRTLTFGLNLSLY